MGTITLTVAERMELRRRANSRAGRADHARRARLILLLDAGETWSAICEKLDCTDAFIDRWSKRYRVQRLPGLFSRYAGRQAIRLNAQLETQILEWTLKRKPIDGSPYWSTRKLAEQLGISHLVVARVWRKHALRAPRLDRYMAADDLNS
jgi:transposase